MKSFLRDAVVIVALAVVLAVAILFFSGSIRVHAAPIVYTARTLSETRGIVTLVTCDSHTQFEYHNDDYVACGTMQPTQKRTERNTPIVEPTVPTVPVIEDTTTPETPIVIDNDGATLPDDTVTEEPTTEEPESTVSGNPGNGKDVGHAGEKCEKSMCENADGVTGEHGKSNND